MEHLTTLRKRRDGTYVFEDGGVDIENPLFSSCSRFVYNPEHPEGFSPTDYDFGIWDTGGGCTAWGQYFLDEDGKKVYMLITDIDGISHEITGRALFGVYDSDDCGEGRVNWERDGFGSPQNIVIHQGAAAMSKVLEEMLVGEEHAYYAENLSQDIQQQELDGAVGTACWALIQKGDGLLADMPDVTDGARDRVRDAICDQCAGFLEAGGK